MIKVEKPMTRNDTKIDESIYEAGQRKWTGRTRGGYLGNWIFITLTRWVGLWWAYLLLVPVSFYYLFSAPKAVKASRDYLRRVNYGGRSWPARIWATYRHFYSFGMTLVDRVAVMGGGASRLRFVFEGENHLRSALAEGKGLILISAHCGNWQAAASLLGRLDAPVNVVAYEGEAEHIRRLFAVALENRVFSLISLDDPSRAGIEIMGALQRGEILAMHADRMLDSNTSERVPFLGSPASFPVGPFAAAAVSGAPLIHAFAMRSRIGCYHLFAYPPEHLTFGNRAARRQQLRQWTELFTRRLEENLKKYPLQWYNFYYFWEDPGGAAKGTP